MTMQRRYNRRTAMRVKQGKVKRCNRHLPTGLRGYTLDRRSPLRGFRHVVTKRDVQAFIDIIPDWHQLSERLDRIILTSSRSESDGCYTFYPSDQLSVISLHAWPRDLWMEIPESYFEPHKGVFAELGVAHDKAKETVLCRFTEAQARAFMLLHVFLHELGHHHDRLRQRDRGSTSGEDYAEDFANERFRQLYPDYLRVFGNPAVGR